MSLLLSGVQGETGGGRSGCTLESPSEACDRALLRHLGQRAKAQRCALVSLQGTRRETPGADPLVPGGATEAFAGVTAVLLCKFGLES